jgi:hypothetical protein
MSKQPLVQIDKRIRSRHYNVSDVNAAQLQAELDKLPDRSGDYDVIDLPQPAIANPAEADASADDAASN